MNNKHRTMISFHCSNRESNDDKNELREECRAQNRDIEIEIETMKHFEFVHTYRYHMNMVLFNN